MQKYKIIINYALLIMNYFVFLHYEKSDDKA